MSLLGRIYKKVLQEARASEGKIEQAIDRHNLVVIRYNTHGEHVAMANRLCGVFAYGTTKAGNPCIRVFEYEGDTTTFVPGWKLIRLDRILAWYPTKRTISYPPNDLFNPNGDNSMSMVYKVAKFDGTPTTIPQSTNPITASNIKTGQTQQQKEKLSTNLKKAQQGLKPYIQQPQITPSNEPKTAQSISTGAKERLGLGTKYGNKPIMKTDTENAMDYLRKQLENPEKIDLSKFNKNTQNKTQQNNATQNVNQAKPAAQQPMITRKGVGQQYANKTIKKTDTENAMDYLRKQLENPEKIDLEKIPKK